MAVKYEAILWNRQKKIYDRLLWFGILLVLVTFGIAELLLHPDITIETLIIRATAFTAIILLHIVLLIGPLARLDRRFNPLLYNRRHLGVSMFFMALIHGVFSIIQFHALGDINPFLSVFTSNQNYEAISQFPFQILGFFALFILLLMAATSHDFWLKNLSPKVWKSLHLLVYVAYALIIAHIALGTLQYENDPIYFGLLTSGFLAISGLHLFTGWKEMKMLSVQKSALEKEGFYQVAKLSDIEEKCAKGLFINGENIAVFKYDGKVSAVNNVCRHQMGPLSEGKVIDACITCPWHGYQYLPENGQAPAPFKEKLETYQVQVIGEDIWVNPTPFPEGTALEAATF